MLVIKDPANPENEGKVKLYRFGPMIFKMIEEQMFPKFDDEAPMNPFDPWEGANFNIKIVGKQVGRDTVPNYEKSVFSAPSPMGEDDFIEKIYEHVYSLSEFTAPGNFKTEDELKRKLFDVLGPTVGSGIVTVEGYNVPGETRPVQRRQTETIVERDSDEAQTSRQAPATEGTDDEDLDFIKGLIADL